jgi:hypothetical protein
MPGHDSRLLIATIVVGAALTVLASPPARDRARDAGRHRGVPPSGLACGTVRPLPAARTSAVTPMADGTPVSLVQEPPILSAIYEGDIRLRDLIVMGDVSDVTFERDDPESDLPIVETWPRRETRNVAGRLASVFDLAWPNAALRGHLRRASKGFDTPLVFWGTLQISSADTLRRAGVWLRFGSTGIPPAEIVRLSDTVQYASHVVNLVVPQFGDSRIIRGPKDQDQARVARRFYEDFADDYDALAFVAQAVHLDTFLAFHRNVKNDVTGIGLSLFDDSASYGSTGRLRSVETFNGPWLATNAVSSHEIEHQWGHYFDWDRLGVTRTDEQATAHAPLLSAGETFLGLALEPTRRVRQVAEEVWSVERTASPARQHPLELYAMGLVPAEQVPEVRVFEGQEQLAVHGTEPAPGTPVTGPARRFTVNDLLALHGSRSGPVPTVWRRATIVVSRDQLISPEEMSYWNFHAARLEDPQRTGVLSYDGVPGFDESTYGRVDLQTDITPRSAAKLAQGADVSTPRFGTRDCRDVEFAIAPPSAYRIREEVRLEGRVTASDERFDNMLVRFWKYGGDSAAALRFYDSVSASGSFSPRVMFREGEEGTYLMEVFLFWPDSGSQWPRCTLTPVVAR